MDKSTLLIVNGDDFGYTKGISDGVIQAHSNGIVTSTSIMANGMAFDYAVSLLVENPSLGVGIHLNVFEGKPVAPPESIPGLLDHDGNFLRADVIRKARRLELSEREVYLEFAAQVEKCLARGVRLNHIDSHQHLHLFPQVLRAVLKLSKEYKIRAVRTQRILRDYRCASGEVLCRASKIPADTLRLLHFKYMKREAITVADYLVNDQVIGDQSFEMDEKARWDGKLFHLAPGKYEVCCHVGLIDSVTSPDKDMIWSAHGAS